IFQDPAPCNTQTPASPPRLAAPLVGRQAVSHASPEVTQLGRVCTHAINPITHFVDNVLSIVRRESFLREFDNMPTMMVDEIVYKFVTELLLVEREYDPLH